VTRKSSPGFAYRGQLSTAFNFANTWQRLNFSLCVRNRIQYEKETIFYKLPDFKKLPSMTVEKDEYMRKM